MAPQSKWGLALTVGLAACSGGNQGGGGGNAPGGGGMAGDDPMGGSDVAGAGGDMSQAMGGAAMGGSSGTGGDTNGAVDDASPGMTMSDNDGAPDVDEIETGPQTLFSFDDDSDFHLCAGGIVLPPCWLISVDGMSGVDGGTLAPVADEAIDGHAPARAAAWSAIHQSYGGNVRVLATFSPDRNWSRRTRLHFNIKATSGVSSIDSFNLFIQGGVEVAYQSIYQFNLADQLAPPEAAGAFIDFSIDLTSPDVNLAALNGVSGVGVVLRAVPMPDAGGDAVPPPTVIELDNIWVE
jgi:hypothetical protein